MSKSKELSLASNSNSKSNLSSGKFASKFCCTKSNSIDETNKDSRNSKANILIENDFKFIDEETTCNSSKINSTEKLHQKPLKNNPKSHDSSQAVFCNKKNETINEAQNPNKKKESASQSQILKEVDYSKSTDNTKSNEDGFEESVHIPSHNEVNKADKCEESAVNGCNQNNLPESKNYGEREAAEKSQKYNSTDPRETEKKTEKQKGGIVRVIITNFKQAAEDEAKTSGTTVNSSGGAQRDVNPTVNETTIKSDLDHKVKPGKMCSGVTRSDESDNNVCLSDKFQKGVSEVIKKNLSDMNDQNENLDVSGCGGSKKGDLTSILLDDDDPYNELQEYLEKIKREINEAFEQHQQRNDELPRSSSPDSTANSNKLSSNERQFFLNDTSNGRELNEICSSQSGKLTAANKSAGSLDYDQEKLKLENQLKCLIRQEQRSEESNRDSSSYNARDSGDVNVWANSILKELDNLMGSDKLAAAKSENARNEKAQTRNILKPEKHATIPLQSFNLNVQSTESKTPQPKKFAIANNPKMSSLFSNKNTSLQDVAKEDSSKYPLSILKIEEDNKNNSDISSPTSTTFSKKERDLLNETAKKGSTSTLWTSEESILRSAGTVDEDNKSTSSSACEDTSIVLSSGKSGNSLDSSENDNDLGEVSPSASRMNWNNALLQNSMPKQNSREICDSYPFRKNKFCTNSNAAAVADDPDLLEVLSLCGGGVNYDDDLFNSNVNYFDAVDSKNSDTEDSEVILRNKPKLEINENRPHAISAPVERNRKCRSHSIAESSFPLIPTECEIYDKFPCKNTKPKRPFYLPFTQEPFRNGNSSNIRELPSPSSASLHSGHENMVIQELTTKSNSAPILLKKEKRNDVFSVQQNSLRYSRSQSDRYLAEIEAVEACKWLRAAGFPQYAQMYEDHQFPIDLSSVANDHPLLENDPLQSLYRRLAILNKCAAMRVDSARKHGQQKDDSDDEGFALSENWMFQPQSRRWSRIGETGLEIPTKQLQEKVDCSSKESSPDRFEDDAQAANLAFSTLPLRSDTSQSECDAAESRLRRTGSERLKDGAKAFLRRVESIKSRRRKRQNREGLVISGPQVLDLNNFTPRSIKTVNITLSNPPSPSPTSPVASFPRSPLFGNELKIPNDREKFLSPNRLSPKRIPTTPRSAQSTHASPLHFFAHPMPHLVEGKSDDSSSYCSDSQDSTSGLVTMRRQTHRSRRFLQRTGKVDDIGIHSDSECHQPSGRKMIFKDTNSNNTEVKVKKLTRGGSLNLGRDSKKVRGTFQSRSFRSRSSVRKNVISSESDKEDSKKRSPVVRWHSFREKEHPPLIFKKCVAGKSDSRLEGTSFAAMSCGQLQIIRKLALVTLTGYMERYCPSHRSGWNWELPKFIKKIKTPDYKDKKVFGVPFLLVLQRTGYSLPFPIRAAFRWLRLNAFDQIGLFRKSGVKSRIAKLKELVESSDVDCMDIYDTQQAYDVADMLKQYFRDLPETLLTSKMSETFVAIFHHLPPEVQAEAVQSAVLLLPDENREVLYSLLEFLHEIAAHSQYNQMTANNLAVCWAPSLFSNSLAVGRSTAVSPRRRKVAGVPDMRELTETRASHECLSFMISNYKQIFRASYEKMKHCNFGYMEESKPVPLEALGEGLPFQNWRGYLYECTSATIKEGREKTRGWVSIASLDSSVEIAFKKVGDGHPLRLWRCITEVEAPPIEVLDYILKERSSWDINLMKCRIVQKLDERNEIFQYTCDGQRPTDYCVLRSWQSDLPKGACVIVETSVEHQNASRMQGAVRGVVLASRFLIEPCGSGRSRVMHLARVDAKGRTPDFYNKCYGHICSHYLSKIRAAFRHVADGPESKV